MKSKFEYKFKSTLITTHTNRPFSVHMADSVDKAFESLTMLKICLKRIHWFSPGINRDEMLQDMGKCIEANHQTLIGSGLVEKTSIKPEHLHVACRFGRPNIVKALVLQYDQDPYALLQGGWSTLHTAAVCNQKKVVQMLLTLGVKDKPTDDEVRAVDIRPDLYDDTDGKFSCDINVITFDWLLEAEFQRTASGNSSIPLQRISRYLCYGIECAGFHWAFNLKWNRRLAVRAAKALGIDDGIPDWRNLRSMFEFMVARNSLTLCYILFGCVGTDIANAFPKQADDTLALAIRTNNVPIIRFLLEHGVKPKWKISYNSVSRALCDICIDGNVECLHFLLEYGIYPYTLFIRLCHQRKHLYLQSVGGRGLDINNVKNEYGETPLHAVCKQIKSAAKRARVLLQHGADPRMPDNMGITPIDIVCKSTSKELVLVFEEHLGTQLVTDREIEDNKRLLNLYFKAKFKEQKRVGRLLTRLKKTLVRKMVEEEQSRSATAAVAAAAAADRGREQDGNSEDEPSAKRGRPE